MTETGTGTKRRQRRYDAETVDRIESAYKAALSAVVEAQKAQNTLIGQWFKLFEANGQPSKGWINDERREWLEEMKEDKGEAFFPPNMSHDEQIEWLDENVRGIGSGF